MIYTDFLVFFCLYLLLGDSLAVKKGEIYVSNVSDQLTYSNAVKQCSSMEMKLAVINTGKDLYDIAITRHGDVDLLDGNQSTFWIGGNNRTNQCPVITHQAVNNISQYTYSNVDCMHLNRYICVMSRDNIFPGYISKQDETATINEGAIICDKKDMVMVEIFNKKVNLKLIEEIKRTQQFSTGSYFWTAGVFSALHDNFVWATNMTEFSYTNWADGYPKPYYGNCVAVRFNSALDVGEFVNTDCKEKLRYVCTTYNSYEELLEDDSGIINWFKKNVGKTLNFGKHAVKKIVNLPGDLLSIITP